MENKKIILTTLSPKTHRTSEENLGIEYLKSSLINYGYKVIIIDGWLNELSVDDVFNQIITNDNILFVGISSYMSNTLPTVELINKLKKYDENIKIVCGGFGPTFYPKEYLEAGSDFIIRGEGEIAICELAENILNNKKNFNINNIGYLKDGELLLNRMNKLIDDLDSIPFPSRDTIETVVSKKSSVNIITSRGCSGNCDFCSIISFFRLADGKVWRTRSINNIVDELQLLYNNGITNIKIVDDSFIDGTRDEKWCKAFADEIERRNIKVRLRGQIRADKINDTILRELKRAGFFSFACGIENGSEAALKRMNKKATLKDNKNALYLFKKYSYIVQMGFILFDEKTTLQELEDNYKFMKEFDFVVTKGIFSEMFSAEGTRLNNRLREENKLINSNFILNNNKYELENKIVKKIYDGLKKWHKSHSYIYDMTIDPITAPKSIATSEILKFYKYTMKLKKLDLLIFKKILAEIKKDPNADIDILVDLFIEKTNDEYIKIDNEVRLLYKKNNLMYNAQLNPFI